MNTQEKKEHLARLNFCRQFLHLHDMLEVRENDNVHRRISKYQDKNEIEITEEELHNVEIIIKK